MRILYPPTKIKNKYGVLRLVIITNEGTFSVIELAKHTGLTRSALLCRLVRMGWDHPDLFEPLVTGGLTFKERKKRETSDDGSMFYQWSRLSNKPRDIRLASIPSPSKQEMEYML